MTTAAIGKALGGRNGAARWQADMTGHAPDIAKMSATGIGHQTGQTRTPPYKGCPVSGLSYRPHLKERKRPMASNEIISGQETNLGVRVVVTWLKEKGFGDAATHLAQASGEVTRRIGDAYDVEWLHYLHDRNEAIRRSGIEDDLPW